MMSKITDFYDNKICGSCHKEFPSLKTSIAKYCSVKCAGVASKKKRLENGFLYAAGDGFKKMRDVDAL